MLSFLATPSGKPATTSGQPNLPVVNGIGYASCCGIITGSTRDGLAARLLQLADMGARTVRISMRSPGGDVTAVRDLVAAMDRLHRDRGIQFEIYNRGGIARAATYLFLAAQRRYAEPDSSFSFRYGDLPSRTLFGPESLREFYNDANASREELRTLLKSRDQISDAVIDKYLDRTTSVTAQEALRDGLVNAIRSYPAPLLPGGSR